MLQVFPLAIHSMIFLEFMITLALTTLLVSIRGGISYKLPSLNIRFSFIYIFSLCAFIISFFDILFLEKLFVSLIYLFFIFFISAMGKGKLLTRIMMVIATIGSFIASFYAFYIPSFGSDTWRDATMAQQLIVYGRVSNLTVIHDAYPLPLVPFLYTSLSLVSGVDSLWASVLVGLEYLLLLSLAVFLLSRNVVGVADLLHLSVLLLLSIPVVLTWSTGFIPQSYSLLLGVVLVLLYLKQRDFMFLPFMVISIAVVLAHGGVATFLLFILLMLLHRRSESRNRYFLLFYSTIYILYILYSTVIYPLVHSSISIIDAVKAFITGEVITKRFVPARVENNISALFFFVPIAVMVATSLPLLITGGLEMRYRRAIMFTLGFLAIAFVISQSFPAFDAVRYLGYTSVVMLSIFMPVGLYMVLARNFYYGLFLLVMAFASPVVGGLLAPANPGPPFVPNYFVLSYSDAVCAGEVSDLARGRVAFDFMTGLYVLWNSAVEGRHLATPVGMYHRFSVDGVEVFRVGAYGVSLRESYAKGAVAVVRSRVVESGIAVRYDFEDKYLVRTLL
ncbi:MAG: hypothetical protein ACP5IE_06365, partial [Infirmifilum sp.]